MLDRETIELFQQMKKQSQDRHNDADPLAALKTPLEVIAWLIETARKDGFDECDAAELLLLDKDRETLREHASTLKLLGYHAVAYRLGRMARQRTRTPRRERYLLASMKLAPRHRDAL